jgi:putative ABC transport system permease protein
VIGVVRNFHFTSLRQKIEPLAFYIDPHANQFLSIRLRGGDISGGLRTIERTYSLFSPNRPFEYFFLDDYWHKLYGNEEDLKSLFLEFTGLAVFLACLGLFGLAAYSAERRAKEVGIRKVLGASVVNLMVMLSGDVAKWVLAANVIAWPIAYFAMERWLQNFAYRVDLGWWTFFLAGGLTFCVALLTVSAQAMRAARANPVESLRYE